MPDPTPSVAMITGSTLPRPDTESPVLIDALAALGVSAEIQPWAAEDVDWDAYALLLLRSPWDYIAHAVAFRDWIRTHGAGGRMVNPAAVVEWNMHKSYLLELQDAGVPVVPTVLVPAASAPDAAAGAAAAIAAGQPRYDVIVKPAVSVGSVGLLRAGDDAGVRAHAAELLGTGDIIIQPFQDDVVTDGETSLLFFDGVFSHAIRKRAADGDFRVQERYGGTVDVHLPSPAEFEVAHAALACAPEPPLYARVDLIGGERPLLGELELIEPELFLRVDARSPARFARAIVQRLAD